ncbi:MAG: hypothetical protein GX177_09910 [Firmicutes bacterium]|jgi:hypothetical protein|nr:hypothetical protein [Bacillota bacterium]
MKADYYSDLALGYIQGSLTPQEKQEVFQLIMEAPDFCEILLLELELSRTLTECKTAPPKKTAANVYFRVLASAAAQPSAKLAESFLTPIFRASLPNLVTWMIFNYQRRVFVDAR